jgi:hypothetical protein
MITPNDHLKIYYDKELHNEIDDSTLDLGTLKAGESKLYTFFVRNDGWGEFFELQFAVDHEELLIEMAPEFLAPNEVKELRIRWRSTVDIEQPQKAQLSITGKGRYLYFQP